MNLYLCNVNGDVLFRKAKDEFTLRRHLRREYFQKFGRVTINEVRFVKKVERRKHSKKQLTN